MSFWNHFVKLLLSLLQPPFIKKESINCPVLIILFIIWGGGPSKITIFKNSNFLVSNGGREFIKEIDHKFHNLVHQVSNWKKNTFCWRYITFSLKELNRLNTWKKLANFVFLVTSSGCESDIFLCRSWIWWKKFGKKRVQQRLQQAFWTKVAVTIQVITRIQTPPSWCRETLRSSQKAQDTTFYPDQVSGKAFLAKLFLLFYIQWSINYPNLFRRLEKE